MAEKLEDLNLPNTTVQRIFKEVIPDNISISKDARSSLSRAGSVFILYVTSQATKEAQKHNRKMLLGQDIIKALEELEFEQFIDPLKDMLNELKEHKVKRPSKPKKSDSNIEGNNAGENPTATVHDDHHEADDSSES